MARARVVPSRKGFTMNKVPEAARPSLPFRKSCATLASIVVLLLAGQTRKRPSAYSTFFISVCVRVRGKEVEEEEDVERQRYH